MTVQRAEAALWGGFRQLPGRTLPLLLMSAAALGACAVNPALDLSGVPGGEIRNVALSTPFFPQSDNQCGPAALATVLVHAGVETDPERLSAEVYLPARGGSLQVELLAASRRAGRIPYVIDRVPEALLGELSAGRPVLVLQNLRTPGWPAWHYAVLTGFDTDRNEFLLNSGDERGTRLAAQRFLRTWNWADRWAMVVLRPGELPVRPDVVRYLESAAQFETVAGGPATLPAWEAAARQWPDHPGPALALGNAAYRRGDLDAAARHYSAGLKLHPHDPGLANNLASVLGESGCPRTGEAQLQPALANLDPASGWRPVLLQTRDELAAQVGHDAASCASIRSPVAPP